MRLAAPAKPSSAKTEQIILFRVSGQLFAVQSRKSAAWIACPAQPKTSVRQGFEK